MHERFKARLAQLEAERRLRDEPVQPIHFCFVGKGGELESTIAEGPRGLVCRRHPAEALDDFKARASAEALAAHVHGLPPPILIFTTENPGKEGSPNAAA
jgi:hypothetical protein